MARWYLSDDNTDVIVTSRIRIARNISGVPFGVNLSEDDRKDINLRVKNAILESNTPFAKSLRFIEMKDIPENECYAMVERHIISPAFAKNRENKAIILSDDESICVMIGEEDHIRIQVLYSGMCLNKAYDMAERIDTLLCDKLHFAYDKQLGFLTECPTNLGTGLRASVMLHLPMLESSREMSVILDSVSKIGFTVRGMYGEGSDSSAGLYQLSNQITLGITEKDAIQNLQSIANQIVEREQKLRESYDGAVIEDKVWRAYGLLKNARNMSSKEMMSLVSMIKLGADMGILDIERHIPTQILTECQVNMLISKYGEMDAAERDIKRADAIRNLL